ncbi:MAG: ABC transporter ATP-binding protein [Gammaproteobacteria bacterium]|nr:MAG: ABC transporter ATP-binding protein [Gammaproteobacteria bacterium]UCH41304.1 MAG: ABC transporter ATP-binding protein [Gammaproteobacteria bacterium]
MTSQLDVENIDCGYDDLQVLNQVSISLQPGHIGCMLGPSGCGKTTVLRAIAGFEPIWRGRILIDGIEVSSAKTCLVPEKRNIGMVFQDFALFPHLKVEDNVRFGLRGMERKQQRARVHEMLAIVGMPAYAQAYPHQLSGGQQQRIALARALAPRPGVLLLDEPFSNMDAEMREQLAREVRSILNQENSTAILVTHDQNEAFAMADQICVMNEGSIQQQGSGYDLYHEPANRFVADFIGQGVILPATVESETTVRTDLGIIHGSAPLSDAPGATVDVLIRPDDVVHDDNASESAIVVEKAFRGADFLYHLRMDSGIEVMCLAPSHHNHKINERIGIRLNVDHLVTFSRS